MLYSSQLVKMTHLCPPGLVRLNFVQILINRESLRHLDFDIELLGDCDVICNELLVRLGHEWTTHCKRKEQIQVLPLDDVIEKGLQEEERKGEKNEEEERRGEKKEEKQEKKKEDEEKNPRESDVNGIESSSEGQENVEEKSKPPSTSDGDNKSMQGETVLENLCTNLHSVCLMRPDYTCICLQSNTLYSGQRI